MTSSVINNSSILIGQIAPEEAVGLGLVHNTSLQLDKNTLGCFHERFVVELHVGAVLGSFSQSSLYSSEVVLSSKAVSTAGL